VQNQEWRREKEGKEKEVYTKIKKAKGQFESDSLSR